MVAIDHSGRSSNYNTKACTQVDLVIDSAEFPAGDQAEFASHTTPNLDSHTEEGRERSHHNCPVRRHAAHVSLGYNPSLQYATLGRRCTAD